MLGGFDLMAMSLVERYPWAWVRDHSRRRGRGAELGGSRPAQAPPEVPELLKDPITWLILAFTVALVAFFWVAGDRAYEYESAVGDRRAITGSGHSGLASWGPFECRCGDVVDAQRSRLFQWAVKGAYK